MTIVRIVNYNSNIKNMTTLEDIKTMISEEVEKLHAIGVYPVSVDKVEIVKARSFYADAWRTRNKIRVSYYFLEASPMLIRGTIMHELIHMVPESGHGHGSEWKRIAAKVNRAYPQYSIKRVGGQLSNGESWSLRQAANREAPISRSIKVMCPCCGEVWTRTRNSRLTLHPELYRCGKCCVPLIKA